jgi:urate oxidase
VDWAKTWTDVRAILLERFASVHSLALQQTLWEMGKAVLETHPEIEEVSLSAPDKHHFAVDLTPFGLENPDEVFHAAPAPYGLIRATITRD